MSKKFHIATIGKTVGIKGFLKIHFFTDFLEQFKKRKVWNTDRGELKIESINVEKNLVKFVGIDSPEDAKPLVNLKLFSNTEMSREDCNLNKDEFFWFDIVGLTVIEGDEVLGTVSEIDRIGNIDYLIVDTDNDLIEQEFPKSFLIPYIERFIEKTDLQSKKIFVDGGKDILESS